MCKQVCVCVCMYVCKSVCMPCANSYVCKYVEADMYRNILLVKRFWYATARSLSELPRELVYCILVRVKAFVRAERELTLQVLSLLEFLRVLFWFFGSGPQIGLFVLALTQSTTWWLRRATNPRLVTETRRAYLGLSSVLKSARPCLFAFIYLEIWSSTVFFWGLRS
jgi:hypothetical protein